MIFIEIHPLQWIDISGAIHNHLAPITFFRAHLQAAISPSHEGITQSIQQDATQMPVSTVLHGVLESLSPKLPGGRWLL